jgi:hypothetical protein
MSDYYINQPTRQDATRRRRYADSARKQWYAKHRAERWRVHYFGEISSFRESSRCDSLEYLGFSSTLHLFPRIVFRKVPKTAVQMVAHDSFASSGPYRASFFCNLIRAEMTYV